MFVLLKLFFRILSIDISFLYSKIKYIFYKNKKESAFVLPSEKYDYFILSYRLYIIILIHYLCICINSHILITEHISIINDHSKCLCW